MISYPSGTLLVVKVNGADDFVENALDYANLESILSSNVVTITGAQTISGEKTFQPTTFFTTIQNISGSNLDIKVEDSVQSIDFYTNNSLKLSLDPDGWLSHKSHSGYTGSDHVIVTSGIQTTDDVDTNLLIFPLEDNSAYWFELYAIGRRESGSPFRIRMEHNQICAYREGGGGATLVGTVNNVLTRSLLAGAWEITGTVSGNDFIVTVNGNTGESVNWVGTLRAQRVSLST